MKLAIQGTCLCKAVQLGAARKPRQVTQCNCSTCRSYGTLWAYYPRSAVSITAPRGGLEDFSVRNGPDLYVYLSPSAKGYAKGALELGKLKATDGSFGYDLPDGADPAAYKSAIVWCKQFAHLFATAPFET